MVFQKQGSVSQLLTANIVTVNDWNSFIKNSTSNTSSLLEEPQVVATLDDDCIYVHGTILASVDLEKNSKYLVTKEAEKFINDNADCFPREEVLKDYQTFKKYAKTYVEHEQSPEKIKGKCIDVVARNMGDTVLVDVLFSIDKKYADLVHAVEKGYVNTLSMGCQTGYTMCSICGNKAHNEDEHCEHIKNQKGRMAEAKDGSMRKVAEVCYDNTWIDVSIVTNPAFAGAVLRKIISRDDASRKVLSNILQKSITQTALAEGVMLKVASKQSKTTTKSAFKEIAKIMMNASGGIVIQPFVTTDSGDVEDQRDTVETENYYPYHPIVNTTSDDDFSVKDFFAPLPWRNPHDVKDDFDVANPNNESRIEGPISEPIKVSSTSQWKCVRCGHSKEKWLVKSACIDKKSNAFKCEKCGFIEEVEVENLDSAQNNPFSLEQGIEHVQNKIIEKWQPDDIKEFIRQQYPQGYTAILDRVRQMGLLV